MRQVIAGKLYDTEGAKRQGYWSNGLGYDDFSWCEETLYKTRSGAYFIHGRGGARSRYSISVGQYQWVGAQHIEPVDLAAAKQWAEEHLDADEYASIFGRPEDA